MMSWPSQHVPRLDWSNPLTRGLVSCIVVVGGRMVDLANPARSFTVAGKTAGRGLRGRHIQSIGGTEHLIPSPAIPTASGNWTYHVLSRYPAAAPNASMVAANPAGAYYSFGFVSGGELVVWAGGTRWFSPSLGMPSTGWAVLSVSGNVAANELRGMIDGAGVCISSATTIAQDITSVLGDSSLVLRGWPDTALFAVYNRTQSDAEMRRLARDPWQIFKPVKRAIPLVRVPAANSYTLAADPGAFTVAGSAAALKVARKLSAAPGSFTLTGTAANLKASRRLAAGAGSFALAGTAASLKASRKLSAAPGSFALTGSAAALKLSRRMPAAGGAISVSGSDAALKAARRLSAAPASFTLTGSAAALKVSRRLPAAAGAFALSGGNATLKVARRLVAAPGAYTLSGGDVTFSLQAERVLTAAPGAFALTGGEAVLRVARHMTAQGGSLTLAGGAATLRISRRLSSQPGSFSVAAGGAALRVSRRLVAEGGAVALAGGAVNFVVDHDVDLTVRPDRMIDGYARVRLIDGYERQRILSGAM